MSGGVIGLGSVEDPVVLQVISGSQLETLSHVHNDEGHCIKNRFGPPCGTVDPVDHPPHYTWLPAGVEVIDITECFSFVLGNVLKYVMRADHKGKPIEDLKKARWYLDREIAHREARDS